MCVFTDLTTIYFTLRRYAEFVEERLKILGLTVDILYPNEDVQMSRVLGNISSRGTLYAIIIEPINEEHDSLTVNILHGTPEGKMFLLC